MTRALAQITLMAIPLSCTAACAARTSPDMHGQAIARPAAIERVAGRSSSTSDGNPLSMDLSAYLTAAPAKVDVRLRVEPDVRTRSVTVEWWTPDGVGGSHLISMEGERAAIRQSYPITRLIQGEYHVVAVLKRSDGSEVRRTKVLIVVGEDGRPDQRVMTGLVDIEAAAPLRAGLP